MTTRRMFLRNGGLALAGAILMPEFLGRTAWAQEATAVAKLGSVIDQYRYYNIRLKGTDLYVMLGEGNDFFYDDQRYVLRDDRASKRSQFHFQRVDGEREVDGPSPIRKGILSDLNPSYRIYCRATGGYISAGGNPVQKRARAYSGPLTAHADADFGGDSLTLNQDEYGNFVYRDSRLNLAQKNISSVRVLDGYVVTLFGAAGKKRSFTADAAYVGDDLNDLAASVKIEKKPGWRIVLLASGAFQFGSAAIDSGARWLGAADGRLVMLPKGSDAQATWELVPIGNTTMTGWTQMTLDDPKKSVEDYVIQASFGLAGAALSYKKVPGGSAVMSALYETFFKKGPNMAETLRQLRSEIVSEAKQAIVGNDVAIAIDKLHTAQKGFAAKYVLERRRFFTNSGSAPLSGAITEAARYTDMARDAAAVLSTPLMGAGRGIIAPDPILSQWKILAGFDTYAACIMLHWAALKEWIALSAYNTDGGGWEDEMRYMENEMRNDQKRLTAMFNYFESARIEGVRYNKKDPYPSQPRDHHQIDVSVKEQAVPGQERDVVARKLKRSQFNESEYQSYHQDYRGELDFELRYAIFPQIASVSDKRIEDILTATREMATALSEDDDSRDEYVESILTAEPVYIED